MEDEQPEPSRPKSPPSQFALPDATEQDLEELRQQEDERVLQEGKRLSRESYLREIRAKQELVKVGVYYREDTMLTAGGRSNCTSGRITVYT